MHVWLCALKLNQEPCQKANIRTMENASLKAETSCRRHSSCH